MSAEFVKNKAVTEYLQKYFFYEESLFIPCGYDKLFDIDICYFMESILQLL